MNLQWIERFESKTQFWEVAFYDKNESGVKPEVRTRFGRLNTKGARLIKSFDSAIDATDYVSKKRKLMAKRGYQQTSRVACDVKKALDKIKSICHSGRVQTRVSSRIY